MLFRSIFRTSAHSTLWDSFDFHSCLNEYEGCLKSIGTIVSCFVFVYCAENGLNFGCEDCCYLIRDILQSEICNSSLKFPQDGESKHLSMKDDFIFRVILSLETSFSLPLQVKVAELFNLLGPFSTVYGAFELSK